MENGRKERCESKNYIDCYFTDAPVATQHLYYRNSAFNCSSIASVSSSQILHSLLMLIKRRSVVYLTRFQAINRWGHILQHQHEIYVWLLCKFGAEIKDIVDALRSNVKVFREAVEFPSDLDALDRIDLLVDCHDIGLRLINLSRGTILMVGPVFEVEWQGLREFSTEDIEKLDMFFRYLLDQSLYVT